MKRSRRSKPQRRDGDAGRPPQAERSRFEAEYLPGLEAFARAELVRLGATEIGAAGAGENAFLFGFGGPRSQLLGLRRCVAIYEVLEFAVPRPKALLGHEHLTRLGVFVEKLRKGPPGTEFTGLRFGAAGSDSPVFMRLGAALAQSTGLPFASEEGDLLLRFRPTASGGWQVLGRLTPRPLSARGWRQCNIPGGLNATVAAAANDLLGGGARDRYLNLMCGSGTLLIERGSAGPWAQGVGVDLHPQATECARKNLEAAGMAHRAELLVADAADLPFSAGSFDRLSADLPWGDAVGEHQHNARLYPRFLTEAARVAAPGARMLVITHELRLFDAALAAQGEWQRAKEQPNGPLRVFHGGHRPGLYLLARS